MQTPNAVHPLVRAGFDRWRATQRAAGAGRGADADLSAWQTPDGIVRFARDILHVQLAPYQEDILRDLVTYHREAVRGPHGIGKTTMASIVVLWAIGCFRVDVKVVTTASAWRQVKEFLWPEIRKWAASADWAALGLDVRRGKELLDMSLEVDQRSAFAAVSDNPALIEGAHASIIIYVFDEAKEIPPGTFDAAEGAFSTGMAFALAISTPGESSGRFYDIHQRKPGYEDWHTRHVTLAEAIAAGRVNPEWAEKRRKQWGEKSAVYQNRVLGEFADSDETSVIPLRWIELANERWRACQGKGPADGKVSEGVDPARFGDDRTGRARLVGEVCEWIKLTAKEDTMQTTGRVVADTGNDKQMPVGVDVIGIGAGVFDRLHELGYQNAVSINVGEATTLKDASGLLGFVNLRSAIWWMLREWLDPANGHNAALPPVDDLTGDLTTPTFTYTSRGEIKVESKDEIRARLGRSTDCADALGGAYYAAHYIPPQMRVGTAPTGLGDYRGG